MQFTNNQPVTATPAENGHFRWDTEKAAERAEARTALIRSIQTRNLKKVILAATRGNVALLAIFISSEVLKRKLTAEKEYGAYRIWHATNSLSPHARVTGRGLVTPSGNMYERSIRDGLVTFDCPDQEYVDALNAAAVRFGVEQCVQTKHVAIFAKIEAAFGLDWMPFPGGGGFVSTSVDERVAIGELVEAVLDKGLSVAVAASRIQRKGDIAALGFAKMLDACQEQRAFEAKREAEREGDEPPAPVVPITVPAKKLTKGNCPTLARIAQVIAIDKIGVKAMNVILQIANSQSLEAAVDTAVGNVENHRQKHLRLFFDGRCERYEAEEAALRDHALTVPGQVQAAISASLAEPVDPSRERMIPIRLPGHASSRNGSYVFLPVTPVQTAGTSSYIGAYNAYAEGGR